MSGCVPLASADGTLHPMRVKQALALQGCNAGVPRAPMPAVSPKQRAAIQAALEGLGVSLRKAA